MNAALTFTQEIPCKKSYDVIVAGGGLAGTAAALTARKRGKTVLLLEKSTILGGLGTLIASMASLISYKQVARADLGLRGRYLRWFTVANLIFLAALLALYGLLYG